jgi:hypothetical protein
MKTLYEKLSELTPDRRAKIETRVDELLAEQPPPKPRMGTKEYEPINEKHCANPQPGDYWHEMFCPYLVVLQRVVDSVIVYQKRKDVPANKWTWDTDAPSMISLADLRKKVTFGSIPGFVASVEPGAHKVFADEFAARAGKGE